jgi:hypothetical protein
VQVGDHDRVPELERSLRALCLPEQYTESYPLTLAHAMVLGLRIAALRRWERHRNLKP